METVLAMADAHGSERELRKFPTIDRDFTVATIVSPGGALEAAKETPAA